MAHPLTHNLNMNNDHTQHCYKAPKNTFTVDTAGGGGCEGLTRVNTLPAQCVCVCVSVCHVHECAGFTGDCRLSEAMEALASAGQTNMYWLSIARLWPRSGSSS